MSVSRQDVAGRALRDGVQIDDRFSGASAVPVLARMSAFGWSGPKEDVVRCLGATTEPSSHSHAQLCHCCDLGDMVGDNFAEAKPKALNYINKIRSIGGGGATAVEPSLGR